ncbi:MAG: co-chaperone GroES [Bacteroidales bacterium]|nr:co-chaperone GroES [Bacteroidales bacterium]
MGNNNIDKLLVIGDRVLIEPSVATHKTKGGLLLPAGYQEKEEIQTGYIIKTGPGYPLPAEADESWSPSSGEPRYLPLQVKPGDMAIFMLKNAVEIKYDGEKYFIVPQSGILMVERDEF